MPEFKMLQKQLEVRFAKLAKLASNTLYTVEVSKEEIIDTYLNNLPESDRQYHNCNCCKNFLHHYGNVVAIINGKVESIWDFPSDGMYKESVEALKALVLASSISGIFLTEERMLGTPFNLQNREEGVKRWEHFHYLLPKSYAGRGGLSIESQKGDIATTAQMFARALDTISIRSVNIVLELIEENAIYRGAEFKAIILDLKKHKMTYLLIPDLTATMYAWEHFTTPSARIRNTAIGTLLVAISEGTPIEQAVTSFESMVAPQNYRRPTALVTSNILNLAEETITRLGYEPSLHRRYATVDDIPLELVIFADKSVRNKSIMSVLQQEVLVDTSSLKNVSEVSLEQFLEGMLPNSESVEILLENKHSPNLVTLVTAENPDAPNLFPWNSPISWSYKSGMADSIKERVKAAGGSVEGELRVSLSWFNYDDLDLFLVEPNGNKIYFRDKRSRFSGGFLDVDMNTGSGGSRNAVENIIFPNASKIVDGIYHVGVHNYCKRETIDCGFEIEIECRGITHFLTFPTDVRNDSKVSVATISYNKEKGIVSLVSGLAGSERAALSKELWGMKSYQFQRVSAICKSPNYWEGSERGNEHTFFLLDKAHAEDAPRPFFNEYLKQELVQHRKVFELLGSRLQVSGGDRQLSGLGFSSTQPNSVYCRMRADGSSRIFKIII
jgi:hypothetical protein